MSLSDKTLISKEFKTFNTRMKFKEMNGIAIKIFRVADLLYKAYVETIRR